MKFFLNAMVVGLVSITSLSACGYHLRGTSQSQATHINSQYKTLKISIEDQKTAFSFKPMLSERLELTGFAVNQNSDNQISVKNLNIRRYELVGILTEVRLVLSADVTYQLGDDSQTHTLQVERSYQFNEAGVATIDQQSSQVERWLYQALAERISEQYYALSKNTP